MIVDPSKMPDNLKPFWHGDHGTVSIYGQPHQFLILSRRLEPAPRYFVAYDHRLCLLPIISDEVPPEWQPPIIAHEIYERDFLGRRPHRCSRAFEHELSHVPADRLAAYLQFRVISLEQLMNFVTGATSGVAYTDEQRSMIAETLCYARWLKQKLAAPALRATT